MAEEISARQSNIVWPGPLANSRGVDEFFWRGSPSPTIIQRVAAWLFAAVFFGSAFVLAIMAWNIGGAALFLLGGMAVLAFALGVRFFRSGFARRPTGEEE